MWLELAHNGSKPLSQFGSVCLIFDSKWLNLTQIGSNCLKIVALIIAAIYSLFWMDLFAMAETDVQLRLCSLGSINQGME